MSRKRRHFRQQGEAGDQRPEDDFESYVEDCREGFEDPENEEEGTEQSEARRSRMAREAKIGLGVIFVLLVVFAGFMYSRLTSAEDGSEPAAATPDAGAGAEAREIADRLDSAPESLAPVWAGEAVSANDGSAEVAQDDAAAGPGSWGAMGDTGQAGALGSRGNGPSSPPSFPPKLLTVPPAGRYAGYPNMPSADSSAQTSPAEQATEPPATDDPARTSLAGDPSQTPSEPDQVGAAGAADATGPNLSGGEGEITVASPPDPRQPMGSDEWSRQPNPLRTQADAAGPTASQTAPRESWDSRYTYASPPSTGDRAGQASVPRPAAGPPATFQAEPGPAPDPRSASAGADDSAPAYPGGPASAPSEGPQPWGSSPGVSQTEVAPPSLADAPSGLSDLGRQEPLIGSSGQEGTYVVQPNDNYWSISKKLYGTDAYFKALAHHNRAKVIDPDRLQLGEEILTPSAAALHDAYPDLCPRPAHREAAQRRALAGGQVPVGRGRVYVVQEGDNLFNIARYELGKATRWTEIVRLNQERLGSTLSDLNYLTPGMKLVLPDDPPPANVGRRPGSGYPR